MKVILLQDVAKLGRRFDVVNVADGFGLNKLVPQGLAQLATPENLKKINAQAAQTKATREASDASFAELTSTLAEKVVDVKVEANEDGKLYQALKLEDIIKGVKESEEVTLTEEQVVIKSPIKLLGEHKIELVSGENHSSLTINVISA